MSTPDDVIMAPRRRRRWPVLLLCVVLFFLGAVTGAGVASLVIVKHIHYALHHPEQFPARVTARLRHSLHLSDDQARQVEAIVRRRQAALQEIRRGVQPQVDKQLEGVREEVAQVLNPEQAAQWRRIFDQKRVMWLPTPPPATSTSSQAELLTN